MRSFSFEIVPAATFEGRRAVTRPSAFRAEVFAQTDPDALASVVAAIGPSVAADYTHKQDDIVEPVKKKSSTLSASLRKSASANQSGAVLSAKAEIAEFVPQLLHEPFGGKSLRGSGTCQTVYKGHSISTKRLPDGSWVASFARVDGAPIFVNGIAQFVSTTTAYLTKLLAVADAEIEIDAITVGGY
jgi:hypothetical protein